MCIYFFSGAKSTDIVTIVEVQFARTSDGVKCLFKRKQLVAGSNGQQSPDRIDENFARISVCTWWVSFWMTHLSRFHLMSVKIRQNPSIECFGPSIA